MWGSLRLAPIISIRTSLIWRFGDAGECCVEEGDFNDDKGHGSQVRAEYTQGDC